MVETYKYGLHDLGGRPVPDSKVGPVMRDMLNATGDFDTDCKKGVCAYLGDERISLHDVDKNKYIIKYIAGVWRLREKPTQTYTVTDVYDKKFILGSEIKITERDDFNFKYYEASLVKYDLFNVMTPEFNWYVAKCWTKHGVMMRYGETREKARAFLRGAILDGFSSNIAKIVLNNKQLQKQ